ncbi:Segregation and condensation protein A [hydrothermal vent metagenome]|uniref:Segregation and condensation protein A n=1 Tax=hydrothermal vent metagenome TaxID=652676 RepID=A0A3B1BU95_9ZZZZ
MPYNVKLDIFEGPLDLLLHLIKDEEVDIYDIPIARITQQYLEYLDLMKALNLDIVGEYLVMASHLTYIKSRMLLPKHEEIEDDLEDGADPREELIAKLVEYKKYKEAALTLKEKEFEQSMIFTRTPAKDDAPDKADLLLDVNVLELIKSFRRVLDNYGGSKELSVTLDEISVTDKINEIVSRLESVDYLTFDALFEFGKNRMEVIATFLALLELIRLKLLRVNQARYSGEILIYRNIEKSSVTDNEPEKEGKGDNNGS